MSIKHKLRTLMLCMPLLAGLMVGVPMRPEKIEELMLSLHQPKIAYAIPDDSENGDDALEKLVGGGES
ncbi:MAG TPA: hypothetical protein VE779_01115 [Candidatus Angelobacter sp.]|nr:hypothetical protein [Candidatus Angelobacter sp.]